MVRYTASPTRSDVRLVGEDSRRIRTGSVGDRISGWGSHWGAMKRAEVEKRGSGRGAEAMRKEE